MCAYTWVFVCVLSGLGWLYSVLPIDEQEKKKDRELRITFFGQKVSLFLLTFRKSKKLHGSPHGKKNEQCSLFRFRKERKVGY